MVEIKAKAGRDWYDQKTRKSCSVHGFQASMATWAGDRSYDDNLIGIALPMPLALRLGAAINDPK